MREERSAATRFSKVSRTKSDMESEHDQYHYFITESLASRTLEADSTRVISRDTTDQSHTGCTVSVGLWYGVSYRLTRTRRLTNPPLRRRGLRDGVFPDDFPFAGLRRSRDHQDA
jgi:hypothetical protein